MLEPVPLKYTWTRTEAKRQVNLLRQCLGAMPHSKADDLSVRLAGFDCVYRPLHGPAFVHRIIHQQNASSAGLVVEPLVDTVVAEAFHVSQRLLKMSGDQAGRNHTAAGDTDHSIKAVSIQQM